MVPGWNTTASDNQIELWGIGFLGVIADEGSVLAELNANEASTLFQDLCLQNGEDVIWSFSHRGRSGREEMRLSIGGTEVVVVATDDAGNGSVTGGSGTATALANNWYGYDGVFTYTGATGLATFGFESTTGTSAGNLLDDIRITLSPLVEFAAATTNSDLEATGGDTPVLLVNGTVGPNTSVDVTVTGGTADGADFTHTVTVSIPEGVYDGSLAMAVPIILTINDDTELEPDETIEFTLASPQSDLLIADTNCDGTTQDSNTYTIENDDRPGISITDVSVDETVGSATLTISLSAPAAGDVTVDYTTTDASATAPDDYATTTGTATILAGETTTTITVPIVDDGLEEGSETFTVDLSNAIGATISDAQAVVTIDDPVAPIAIPTLGQGAMALLTLILAMFGFGALRWETRRD